MTVPSAGLESGLELRISELIGREHQVAVAHLPDWHPDVDGVPEPKRLPNGKLDLRGRSHTSTAARGQMIREQVLAHLPNPLTITLPDGTMTRVWLATGKDGKKIVGDALWWGVNCAGCAETPLEVVSSHETAVPDESTSKPLQGDDYQLEYYADGYPKLPACLDRRRRKLDEAA